MRSNQKAIFRLIIVIILILGMVYAVSVYTGQQEVKKMDSPGLLKTPIKRGSDLK